MAQRSSLRVTSSNQEILQCPICYEIPRDIIFQCVNGHTICSTCCFRVSECPFCKVPFYTETPGRGTRTRIRARGIESMLDAMTFECPNKKLGCEVMLKRGDIRHHLKNDCTHEPPENRGIPFDQQQEGDDHLADLDNIREEMRQDYQNHVRQQRNVDWERNLGAAVFLVAGLCFVALLIMSLVSGNEVKWTIFSIKGRPFKLRV